MQRSQGCQLEGKSSQNIWDDVPGDLHLLAIEGRGISAFAALLALREILKRYQYSLKLIDPPRPYDVFDIAGGDGTGGIIMIMLFRLKMNVDDAIRAFIRLSKQVFSKRAMNIASLEGAITEVVCSSLDVDKNNAHSVRMLDDLGPKCFVSASASKNLGSPTLFRTYTPPRHASYNCTIVEAIMATTAEAPFDVGDENERETFINAGLMLNNPLKSVLQESASIFPGHPISCVLSFGSEAQGIIGLDTTSTSWRKVMNDGERISDEVAKELDPDVFYCRLSVDHGLKDTGFEDCHRLGDVKTHTQKYLEKHDIDKKVSELVAVLKRRTVIACTVEDNLMVLRRFLDSLDIELPGDAWSEVIQKFIRGLKPNTARAERFNMHCALLKDTIQSCMLGKDFVELPDELQRNIRTLLEKLKGMFETAILIPPDPLTRMSFTFPPLLRLFWFQNHIAGNIVLHDILKYIQTQDDSLKEGFSRLEQHAINQNLGQLNVAPYAAYDSSEVSKKASCFKGTRVRLLNEIASWITDLGPAQIYVLIGVAGIGKSTIAKTIAEHAAEINALGASFFFSKYDNTRKTTTTFFPTIAYQLALYDSDFADSINKALLGKPHVVTQTLVKQFSTLISEPLKKPLMRGPFILVVIDALDECEDGHELLKIIADSIKDMPRLKLFITTRPEFEIRKVVDPSYSHLKLFRLEDIEKSVVQSDIRLYLEYHLSENQVQERLPHIVYNRKPSKMDMESLIGACGTLFILASTAVKFILDNKQSKPARQLSRLLSPNSGSKHMTDMDSIYTKILSAAIPVDDNDDDNDNNTDDDEDDDGDDDDSDNGDNASYATWSKRYQIVVGSIVALQYPLPCQTLSVLVNMDSNDIIVVLINLHSLVAPTTGDDPIFRIHHKSFPDFVTSPSRCSDQRFLIDLKMRHLELGKRCLKILDSQLRPNICNLSSTVRFRDNSDIQDLTRDRISAQLIYASTQWATHLASASKLDKKAERLLDNFAHKHFFSWLEVLSIIGKVESAYPSLDKIAKLLDGLKTKAGITREIVHDGRRFVALNVEVIKVAAGHVFSAFKFIPRDTRLYQTYRGMRGIKLEVVSGYEERWKPTISNMKGHAKEVTTAIFSGDGTRLASASFDKTVRLWDGQTGAEITVLKGHGYPVNSVAFSPDGTILASASDDNSVRLWDGLTGVRIDVLRGHTDPVNSVVFSPDGTRLASASRTVGLWDGRTGTKIAFLEGHSDWVNSVLFSPNGTILASASCDRTVRLWDGQTGHEIFVLSGHERLVNSVAFSPDGKRFATASGDKTVGLWDSQTCTEIAVLRGHSDWVNSVVFSPKGQILASASSDGTVRLWNSQKAAEFAVLRGHDRVNSVVFSPDGTRLASAYSNGTVRLWYSKTGAQIAVLRGHSKPVKSVVFSPDGKRLASASSDRTVRLWDGQIDTEMAVPRGHLYPVKSVVFSPDGKRLASASDAGTVRLWDGQTGTEIDVLEGHSNFVTLVLFSPDGMRLASASDDRTSQLWDGQIGAEIAVLRGHLHPVKLVVFSPDGTKLGSADDHGTMRLWDSETGNEIAVLRGHSKLVNSMLFSPNGTRLASASSDGSVRLWDGKKGAEIVVLDHLNPVNSVLFSPDGGRFASASSDGMVRLWDGQTFAEIAVLEGHSNPVKSMAFSPDGTRLACSDGMVRMWDTQTYHQISTSLPSEFFSFTSDGSTLVSMKSGILYQLEFTAADKVTTIPVGMSIEKLKRCARVSGSNLWVGAVERNRPSLPGLLVFKIDDNACLRFMTPCWFPTDLPVSVFDVSSLSRVAIGCKDGRIFLLHIDFSTLL